QQNRAGGIRRMPEDCDASELRNKLAEQLQALPGEISSVEGQSRDVAPRASQTWDESDSDRVGHTHKDDWHRRSRFLGRKGRRRRRSQDDVDLESHELFGKARKFLEAPIRESKFDGDILAVDVIQLP